MRKTDREKLLTILRDGLLFETEAVLKIDTPCTQVNDGGFEVQFKGKTYVINIEEAKWRTKNHKRALKNKTDS